MSEPIETRTPWSRPRQEPLTQVEYERKAYEAMTKPGGGKVHPMSITTPTYEPNRPMAPEPKSIIDKKGLKPKKEDTYAPVTPGDRVVITVATSCAIAIIIILVHLFTKMG